jgi:hypothetical protein
MEQTTLEEWAKDPVDPETRAHVYSLITAVCMLYIFDECMLIDDSSVALAMMAPMRLETTPYYVSKTYGNGSSSATGTTTGAMSRDPWPKQTSSRATCWKYSQRSRLGLWRTSGGTSWRSQHVWDKMHWQIPC